ncbi:MAG: LysR family transcriptional regulator [Polyangiaceae bacterium]
MNYQHLFYFRTVAMSGGITRAANELRLTPPTLSAQIRTLEEAIGVALFERTARGMSLTEAGRTALRFADRIFALGAELERTLKSGGDHVVHVGVEASMVSATARPILARLAKSDVGGAGAGRIVCSFRSHDELLADLRAFSLDVLLTTTPVLDVGNADIESRLVIETEVGFFADATTARKLRDGFPRALAGASFIAPSNRVLRDTLARWLGRFEVSMTTTIELGDASIAAALAADGVGIVAAPLSADVELGKRYGLELVGVAEGVLVPVYAVGLGTTLDSLLPSMLVPETKVDGIAS